MAGRPGLAQGDSLASAGPDRQQVGEARALIVLDGRRIDAVVLPGIAAEQRAVIKGDRLCRSIAAASIVAKVLRDRLMSRAHVRYPQYGFLAHKGYGTAEHLRQLQRYGPCDLHRRSFAPVREAAVR